MDLFTINEVAAILKVSKSLVYGMIASGKIACHRIGNGRGVIRIRRDDLEQFISQCRVEPNLPPPQSRRPTLKHLRLKQAGGIAFSRAKSTYPPAGRTST